MSVSIESVREMEWGSAVSSVNSDQLALLRIHFGAGVTVGRGWLRGK